MASTALTPEQFRACFDADFDRLYRYALRYLRSPADAADVVQGVFLTLWEGKHVLALPVLYTVTRRRCLNLLKHQAIEQRLQGRIPSPAVPVTPDDELAEREMAAAIQAAVDTLPLQQRRVLEYRWRDHLSRPEVAERMGLSVRTVDVHLGRALAHLKAALGDPVAHSLTHRD